MHAKGGMPQCRYCLKRFYGWPQFMGHFSQASCPVLHRVSEDHVDPARTPATGNAVVRHPEHPLPTTDAESAPAQGTHASGSAVDMQPAGLADPDPVPLFHRQTFQELARRLDLRTLRAKIRDTNLLYHCPECFQRVTHPSYLARHACKMHPPIADAQDRVLSWALSKGRVSKPCEWCGDSRFRRTEAHLKACPVLWVVGHFLARLSTLEDPSQATLHGSFRRSSGRAAAAGAGGVCSVWGLHEGRPATTGIDRSTVHGTEPGRDGGGHGQEGHGCGQGPPPTAPGGGGSWITAAEACQGGDERSGEAPWSRPRDQLSSVLVVALLARARPRRFGPDLVVLLLRLDLASLATGRFSGRPRRRGGRSATSAGIRRRSAAGTSSMATELGPPAVGSKRI